MINLILSLITAHLIGDYVLQNDFLATQKSNNKFILCVHSWLWTFSIWVAFYVNNINIDIFGLILTFLIHFEIDRIKCNLSKVNKEYSMTKYLYIDQIAHITQIIILMILSI